MAKTITVFNNKGGVGKTTFLCNIAAFIAIKLKKRVLVVDGDPQCNATQYLLPEQRLEKIYDKAKRPTIDAFLDPVRRGRGYVSESVELEDSPRFGVSLVPGDPSLALSEDLLATDWSDGTSGNPRGLQTTFVFADLFSRFDDFDYTFVDVGPSLGAINRAILIGSDYFIVPMSSDLFSLMALRNISISLKKWRRDLKRGLNEHEVEHSVPFEIGAGKAARWALTFAGYLTQQYTAKVSQGERRPVRAYERILKQVPTAIKENLADEFSDLPAGTQYKLGEIPNLHSVVPMSQTAHAPIFALKAKDGVVGAHFAKVAEAEEIYAGIAKNLIENVNIRA